jgi:hypothetical protein
MQVANLPRRYLDESRRHWPENHGVVGMFPTRIGGVQWTMIKFRSGRIHRVDLWLPPPIVSNRRNTEKSSVR